jgi:D-alanyl-D-alanine carboxypeptidase (penicillin-binding protein 5/6)
MDSIRDGKSELVNTNKLIRNYQGATGLKTGSTSIALYNLSASATRDGLNLIAVIMKAPTTKIRFSEATKLLDYGFANYTSKSFGSKGDIIQTVDVNKGIQPQVNVVLEEDACVLIKKGDTGNIIQNIVINENIVAPIKQGDVLGKIQFKAGEEVILEKNLVAEKNIDKSTMWNITQNLYLKWFNMCR